MGILSALGIKGIAIAVLIVVCLAGAWKIERDIEAIGALQAVNLQLVATNKANVIQLAVIQQDYKRAQDALTSTLHAQAARAAHKSSIDQGIANAPASDDGPVAPVLRHVVDGLYGNPGAANSNP